MDGLTVLLIDNTVEKPHAAALDEAIDAFVALREAGAEVRLFSISNRLVELREIPESFAPLTAPGYVLAAVNRVNILRPRRIVVLTDAIRPPLGLVRDGTRGYVWHAQQDRVVSHFLLGGWAALFCAPASVVQEIRRVEESHGVTEVPMRGLARDSERGAEGGTGVPPVVQGDPLAPLQPESEPDSDSNRTGEAPRVEPDRRRRIH